LAITGKTNIHKKRVLWNRIVFYLNEYPDPRSQTNADPSGRVADPDPNWIRIQEGKNDPQK
jgi:hypothetical protein